MNPPPDTREPLFRKRRRYVVFYWVLAGFLLGILLFLAPAYATQIRTPVQTANAEMRNMAVALESYAIDHGVYPPGQPYVGDLDETLHLTTPTVYTSSIPDDPRYGSWEARRALMANKPYAAFLGVLVLAGLWFVWFRRLEESREARALEASLLWIAGGLGALLASLEFDPWHTAFYQQYWPLLGGMVFGYLWWEFARSVRKVAGREVMMAPIMPLLLVFSLLLNGGFELMMQRKLDAMGPWPRYYQYATDGRSWWIMQSTGPDRDYDYDLTTTFGEPALWKTPRGLEDLHTHRYDPSNGTASSGDIFRYGP